MNGQIAKLKAEVNEIKGLLSTLTQQFTSRLEGGNALRASSSHNPQRIDIPLQFFDILQQNRCLRIPKGPALPFWHDERVQVSHFLSDIRFSQYIFSENFSQNYSNF